MPEQKGKLKPDDYNKIRSHFEILKDELDVDDFVDLMFQENIFTRDDVENICSQSSKTGKARSFLWTLLESGPFNAYDVFYKRLEGRYPHLAEVLQARRQNLEIILTETAIQSRKRILGKRGPALEVQEIVQSIKRVRTSFSLANQFPDNCKREADHDRFTRLGKFQITDLPVGFQKKEVIDCLKSLASQTVLVKSRFISSRRPDDFPFSEAKGRYTEYKVRGSGRVLEVIRKFSNVDSKTCPCMECRDAITPQKQWGSFIVAVPKHSVFDDTECDQSEFIIGYNTGEEDEKVLVLRGLAMVTCNWSTNVAEILCVSHDASTCKYVEEIFLQSSVMRERLLANLHLLPVDRKLAVLISHPHGAAKHISVGVWLPYINDLPQSHFRHTYTAAACPHSAGGPVLLLDNENAFVSMHRRRDTSGLNQSVGTTWQL